MKLDKNICDILRKPLPKHTRRGPGGNYDYYKGSDVIRRLNEAFGHSWSSEKVEDVTIDDQILLLVSLTVFTDGDTIIHQGYGSAQIARKRNTNEIIDIGNTYKSAYTNALKKAAEQFGVGLGAEDKTSEESKPANNIAHTSPSVTPKSSFSAPTIPSAVPTSTYKNASAGIRPPMRRTTQLPSRTPGPGLTSSSTLSVAGEGVSSPAPMSPKPVPDTGNELLTSIQESALSTLAKLKGFENNTISLLQGALGATEKTTFAQLLKKEAVLVIRYANELPLQG